jgi:hypothetical protein
VDREREAFNLFYDATASQTILLIPLFCRGYQKVAAGRRDEEKGSEELLLVHRSL